MYKLPKDFIGKNLNVILIGAGGTGSFISEELIFINNIFNEIHNINLNITIADGSNVTQANLIRQKFFIPQVGMNKAEALVYTANNLFNQNFNAYSKNIDDEYIQTHLAEFDIIITALDRPSTRYKIYQALKNKSNKTLWIDAGNDDKSGQVCIGELGKNRYLPTICDLYDYSQLNDKDALIKSCSTAQSLARQTHGVNAMAAKIASQYLYNLITDGEINSSLTFFDLKTLEIDNIEINEEKWSVFGYKPGVG
ncbi:PRTRC system ThiF family protein [Photobacterium leiognathi]|uniref:PRTRC system ThiF family protein n=1 Tax=Photobacterium leiognathi TaxID=553611 RepID=UPI002981F78F|nr:PRTRC system ThiF family protein [Photobacterium leiognathi]